MRQSRFAFMRGTCHLFYDTLPPHPIFDSAPDAWLCGDLHVENFGTYKGDNRLTYFDITDFDATVLGPATLDIVRFLASVLVGAEEWGVERAEADAVAQRALVAYAAELAAAKPAWIERESARGLIKRLFAQVSGRSRTEFLDRVTSRKGKRRRLNPDGKQLVPASESDFACAADMVRFAAASARDDDFFKVVDVARHTSGVGSLGLPRFIVLIEGRGSPDRNSLLDLKCATVSPLAPISGITQPEWNSEADRIVAIQRHSTIVAPAFLSTAPSLDGSFTVRELQLPNDRVQLRDWEKQPKKLAEAIVTMAAVAAWTHLRGGAWRSSAPSEHLSAFARESAWRQTAMELARDAAARTTAQFEDFAAAYDAGYFRPDDPRPDHV